MGTEIQANTYFSGSYSMRDLNDSASSGIWALYHEHKSLKNGLYYDSLLARPDIDEYLGYDKEHLRQTILEHDFIFRYQLAELHRLYKRQRDVMNEIKRRELHQYPIPAETSLSSLFLSHLPSGDVKKTCHVSDLPSMNPTFAGPVTSGTDSIQSPLSFIKGKNTSSPFPSQDRVTSKDHESLESKCNMFQRKLLNLELSDDVYLNNRGKQLEGSTCGVSGMESCPLNRNYEVTCETDVNLSLGSGLCSGRNGDALKSTLYFGKIQDMVDLNEPIHVEEASVSASVDNLVNCTRLDEELWTQAVSVNSRNGGILLSNMHSENEGNHSELLTYKNEAACLRERDGSLCQPSVQWKSRCDTNSFRGGVWAEDSPAPFKSLQVQPCKVDKLSYFFSSDESIKETWRQRKVFGVEISERNHDQSVVASQSPSLYSLIPQSDLANSDSSSLSLWSKASSSSSHNVLSVQENPCTSTSFPSHISSSSLGKSLEFVGGKMQFNSNVKSVSRAEVSYQCGVFISSQSDIKQLQVCCSSMGYDFLNGINSNSSVLEQVVPHGSVKDFKISNCVDVNSVKDMNLDVAPPYRFQNEVILQQNPGSVDGQWMDDNPMGGLPWLKAKELSNVELTKGREDYFQMNLHSLHNYSQQFSNKTEMGNGLSQSLNRDSTSSMSARDNVLEKIKAGICPSNRKIIGFPVFGVRHTSEDLTSLISPSKFSCIASNIDSGNDRKDLGHDPRCEGQLEVKGLVTEKKLVNFVSGLRHHIDLNLCMNEEAAPPIPSLPRAIVKIATTEIDSEVPAVLESETDLSPEVDTLENQLKSASELPLDESKKHNEELVRVAAEAIIDISSSDVHNLMENMTCNSPGVASSDSLYWFAEVVSSFEGDLEGELTAVSRGTDGTCDEECVPDGMDYFEFMTLKLTETKVEKCCNKSTALQNQKDEETGVTVLSKRPWRGQARRGRQRKDFRRDILPSLISLSKHEVTDDLQAIEELFKASGFTWQPSLSQRNTAKNGRGRRHLRGSAPSQTPPVVCPPPVQQPIYRELVNEERTLTGWGKKTRRLPRQRCPTENPTHALKC